MLYCQVISSTMSEESARRRVGLAPAQGLKPLVDTCLQKDYPLAEFNVYHRRHNNRSRLRSPVPIHRWELWLSNHSERSYSALFAHNWPGLSPGACRCVLAVSNEGANRWPKSS